MSRSKAVAFAVFLAAASLGAAAAPAPLAEAGWWDDLDKGDQVKLSDLVAEPRRWKDKVVTFPCIHHAPDSVFQPYFTSFSADKFLNFTAWLDGSPVWEMESYTKDDFPFLYMRRDHPQRDELTRLPALTRIEITGRVKDVYRERPWIEVLGFRTMPATLGKKVVDDVKNGDGWLANGDVTKAESYYRRALSDVSLEEAYANRIRKRLADLLRYAGRAGEASAVEGGSPILGPKAAPLPPTGTLTDAKSKSPGGVAPTPFAPVSPSEDLPGTPFDGPGSLPNARPSARPPSAAPAPPSALTENDLPGTPYGQTPKPPSETLAGGAKGTGPAPSAPAKTDPQAPAPLPSGDAPPKSTGRTSAEGAAQPSGTPLPPTVENGAPPPPPPPARTPRMSGVR